MPQFITEGGNESQQLLILGMSSFPIGFLVLFMYASVADIAKRGLSSNFVEKYLNKVSAGLIALVAILLVGINCFFCGFYCEFTLLFES